MTPATDSSVHDQSATSESPATSSLLSGKLGGKSDIMSELSTVGLRRRKHQPEDRRQRRITVRLSEAEWQAASTGAQQDLPRPMAVSAWLVQQAVRSRNTPIYAAPRSALTAELVSVRRALVAAFADCQQEKRDLIGIATNLNQMMRVANSEGTVGWIAELLPGIYLLRDELAARAQRIDELIHRCDEALP